MKKKISLAVAVGVAAMVAVVGAAGAAGPKFVGPHYQAVLDSAHVIPHPTAPATGASGLFTAVLDGTILRYTLVWKGLPSAQLAQIHVGIPARSGPLAQPLCDPCNAPETGVVPLYDAQLAALKAGHLYVVISATTDMHGDIRGQLTLVK